MYNGYGLMIMVYSKLSHRSRKIIYYVGPCKMCTIMISSRIANLGRPARGRRLQIKTNAEWWWWWWREGGAIKGEWGCRVVRGGGTAVHGKWRACARVQYYSYNKNMRCVRTTVLPNGINHFRVVSVYIHNIVL